MNPKPDGRSAHCLVTGGSSGIGLAIATILADRGHPLTLIARGADDLATAAGEVFRQTGNQPGWEAADVSDEVGLEAAVTRAAGHRGPVEILVAAAGMVKPAAFQDLGDRHFRRQMDVNFFGAVNAVRPIYPSMVAAGRGRIVFISSAAALIGIFGYTAYGASKFALRGFAEALRSEARPSGVSVSIAYPGDTDTAQFAAEMAVRPRETSAITSGGGLADASAVARAIVRGMDRRAFAIYPGLRTAALGRSVSMIAPLLHGSFDRTIRRVRQRPQ